MESLTTCESNGNGPNFGIARQFYCQVDSVKRIFSKDPSKVSNFQETKLKLLSRPFVYHLGLIVDKIVSNRWYLIDTQRSSWISL